MTQNRDWSGLTAVAGTRVLVTGGTGSFGNTVARHFLKEGVAEVRIFSRDEKKQDDMRQSLRDHRATFHIGDVRDESSVHEVMTGIDYVFHAAALKQVPSCEFNPMEAVRTNILGTENVLSAAIDSAVRKVVVLSTDKAVYPVNVMGMSKAMAEKLVVAKSRRVGLGGTILSATRYGNVMGSRGSVIPLFIEQIKRGTPVTITDPSMTRFLMSLEESVELVMHAFTNGQQGDLFVQKAPACTVEVLARALSQMFEVPIDVRVIGARHGEKKHETLVSQEEMVKAEDHGRFLRIPADHRDLNYSITEAPPTASRLAEDYTSATTQQLSVEEVLRILGGLDFVRAVLTKV